MYERVSKVKKKNKVPFKVIRDVRYLTYASYDRCSILHDTPSVIEISTLIHNGIGIINSSSAFELIRDDGFILSSS